MLQLLMLFLVPLVWSQKHTPYGSKTPYHLVAGNVLDFDFPCKPVSLFSVHRHGTRNVGKNIVKRIDTLVGALQSTYKTQGLPNDNLNWLLDFRHGNKPNKDLIVEGYKQLSGQGQRFSQVFPDLLADTSHVRVGTSFKGRCISSALSFLHGAYGKSFRVSNESEILKTKDIRRDCEGMCQVYEPVVEMKSDQPHITFEHQQNHLLRYYKECRNYVTKEGNKVAWQAAPNKYLTGSKMTALTKKMGVRLGIQLSPHDVVTLHILCALEIGVPRLMNNSQFCSLFQENELYVTAFYLDLMRYNGKMIPEAVNSSCVLMQDGLNFLKQGRGANLKFAHTETIFPLLEHIGHLTEPMSAKRSLLEREFYGDITPLGSNFFMVAMECSDSSERIVQTFLNEKPIEFPNCGSPCKLDKILEMFPEEGCDFVGVCEGRGFNLYSCLTVEMAALSIMAVVVIEFIRRCFT